MLMRIRSSLASSPAHSFPYGTPIIGGCTARGMVTDNLYLSARNGTLGFAGSAASDAIRIRMTTPFRTQGWLSDRARRDEADRAANAAERARRCAAERFHVNRGLMVSGGGPLKRPRAQYLVGTVSRPSSRSTLSSPNVSATIQFVVDCRRDAGAPDHRARGSRGDVRWRRSGPRAPVGACSTGGSFGLKESFAPPSTRMRSRSFSYSSR